MRTTVDLVRVVMTTNMSDPNIQVLIEIANRMVTERLTDGSLSTGALRDIETYLTAHLIAVGPERQAEEEEVDDVRVKYQGKFGLGLESTTYGQMVIALDTSGLLSESTKKKASISAIAQFKEDYD
jgi:hypothetical protein